MNTKLIASFSLLVALISLSISACSAVDPEPDPWSEATCKQECARDFPEKGKDRDLCEFNCHL